MLGSAVLWNVFPDLIVRDQRRQNLVGLEIKALHTAAEEKSANLMTPLQIIRRDRDFVVIVSWGWQTGNAGEALITYPHIHALGVFNAWLLAKIRDYGWLLSQGGRIKAIDLATPIINGQQNRFKAEERNMGKLMRIQLPAEMPPTVPEYDALRRENDHYVAFKGQVIALGLRETFLDLCILESATNVKVEAPERYPSECCVLGTALLNGTRRICLIAGNRPDLWLRSGKCPELDDVTACLWLSQKLDWRVYARREQGWTTSGEGAKPDSEFARIQHALTSL